MQQIDQREKTIVFCAKQEHAAAVRDLVSKGGLSLHESLCHIFVL